jgi:hypothetical protein
MFCLFANVMIIFIAKTSSSLNRCQYFRQTFWRKYFFNSNIGPWSRTRVLDSIPSINFGRNLRGKKIKREIKVNYFFKFLDFSASKYKNLRQIHNNGIFFVVCGVKHKTLAHKWRTKKLPKNFWVDMVLYKIGSCKTLAAENRRNEVILVPPPDVSFTAELFTVSTRATRFCDFFYWAIINFGQRFKYRST